MNTDLNNEEYPKLTPPDVVYEHKAALKKPVVIPLYAKLIAAAATVALLFGIFWHRNTLPEQELLAELKPVGPEQVQAVETMVLSESQAHFIVPKKAMKSSSVRPENTYKRNELPLLAELQPITAPILMPLESRPDLWMADEIYYASNDTPIGSQEEYYDDRSLISRGIAKMTDGECESFVDILLGGLRSVKGEMALLATTIQSSRSQLRQRER